MVRDHIPARAIIARSEDCLPARDSRYSLEKWKSDGFWPVSHGFGLVLIGDHGSSNGSGMNDLVFNALFGFPFPFSDSFDRLAARYWMQVSSSHSDLSLFHLIMHISLHYGRSSGVRWPKPVGKCGVRPGRSPFGLDFGPQFKLDEQQHSKNMKLVRIKCRSLQL